MIAGQQRGHQVEPINSTRCYLDVDTGNPEYTMIQALYLSTI